MHALGPEPVHEGSLGRPHVHHCLAASGHPSDPQAERQQLAWCVGRIEFGLVQAALLNGEPTTSGAFGNSGENALNVLATERNDAIGRLRALNKPRGKCAFVYPPKLGQLART